MPVRYGGRVRVWKVCKGAGISSHAPYGQRYPDVAIFAASAFCRQVTLPMQIRAAMPAVALVVLSASSAAVANEFPEDEYIDEIQVEASRVANTRPAGSFAAPATELRFDPTTELQSRGLAEGQSDVTVRGGIFENTGFKFGATTVIDPQTGHYVAELPIDPAFLSRPTLHTGIDNALQGFNSNVATVAYSPTLLRPGGAVRVGAGTDNLRFVTGRLAGVSTSKSGTELAYALSAAHSSGDGTVENGDHRFGRYNALLQRRNDRGQTDFLLSYQDKFYGWPGAYTGFASLPETDDTKTSLIVANHRVDQAAGHIEIGAFFRRLEDDYDFDRRTKETGVPGSFEHETKVYGVGLSGSYRTSSIDWHYAGQVTSDKLVFSTDLTEGEFDSRNYATARLIPAIDFGIANDVVLLFRFGLIADWTSRDGSSVSPVIGVAIDKTTERGRDFLSLDYATSSQVPGYTALNSRPNGLFGGNALLGREEARQITLSIGRDRESWTAEAHLFFRKDDDLVDWTYLSGAPFARQANAVDIEVAGVELVARKRWSDGELFGGYAYLDKDADYGTALVDASYYALNYATHRATAGVVYRPADSLELLVDAEYRDQRENPLRLSADHAFTVSMAVNLSPMRWPRFGFSLVADNLTDDDYQQFPGTPAVGRTISLSAAYSW